MPTDKTAETTGALARERKGRFLAATFRNILLVVFLIFIFAVVRTSILWAVCNAGMKNAVTLQNQGLPALKELASLQESLVLYRLDSYEYLFAQDAQKPGEAKAAEAVALQLRAELKNIQTLFPEGEGRRLATNLETAVDDLDLQFQKVRKLVDEDFPAAMKSMDQDIPPRIERVEAAANALKEFGYQFSGAQADATFASFRAIQRTAVIFGIINCAVAFCAFMFVLLAARRSRAQLSETLARLDERSQELQQSNGALQTEVIEHQRAEETLRESEEKFRQLADNITDVFWITSPDFKVMHFVSAGYEKIWGCSTESLHANPHQWIEAILPEERERAFAAFTPIMDNAPEMSVEYQIARPDGGIRWIHDRGFQVRDAAGKLVRLAGIASDITERKRSEEALRESEERFSGAFELAPIGMALVAPEGRWLKVNRALCKLVGYSEAEMLARTFQEITHPDDLAADLECVRRLLGREIRFYQMEKRYIHARGHFITVLLDISLVRDSQGQPLYFISQIQDITERKRAVEELRWKTAFLEAQVNSSIDAIIVVDENGKKSIQNQQVAELFKIPPAIANGNDDAAQVNWVSGMVKNPREFGEKIAHLYSHPDEISRDEIELNNGTILDRYSAPVVGLDGKYYGRIWTFRDVTGRKKLEAQLFQSQKMETVGKLAGGIAHEFNSILTAIIGQSELLLGDLPDGSPLAKNATEISQAAGRAATLTRQLLAYGRKQFLQPEVLDLNRVLAGMENVFQHLMGTDVDTQIIPAIDLPAIKADAGQIEQVIMNMAMNARDAMPNGGKLILETANVSFDAESVGHYAELKPGDYVMLAITDTGTGMSEAVKTRLFEPFFSTKDVGQGTGLGLSTCYGIVKQSGGHISVYSEQGRGTTFKIYLPQVEAPAKILVPRLDSPDLPHGTETILLVEDDPALREMAATLLRRLGYTVLTAANGVEALSLKHEQGNGHVDLLFTDVVMPHMSGKELADRVRALYPRTKILFTSAYTENAIVHQGVLDKGVALLQKPFTPSTLAHKLREVLDREKRPAD